MKKVFLIFQLLLVVMLAQAQMMNPVKFTSSLKTDGSAAVSYTHLTLPTNREV